MKKSIKIISFVIIIFLVLNAHYSCLAADLDTDITSGRFVKDLNPNGLDGAPETLSTPIVNFIHNVVNPILGFVQIIGAILTVVSVALFGLGMLLTGNEGISRELGLGMGGPHGGPDTKMALLNFGRTMLIGAVLLFCSSTIVKFVFYIFNI